MWVNQINEETPTVSSITKHFRWWRTPYCVTGSIPQMAAVGLLTQQLVSSSNQPCRCSALTCAAYGQRTRMYVIWQTACGYLVPTVSHRARELAIARCPVACSPVIRQGATPLHRVPGTLYKLSIVCCWRAVWQECARQTKALSLTQSVRNVTSSVLPSVSFYAGLFRFAVPFSRQAIGSFARTRDTLFRFENRFF